MTLCFKPLAALLAAGIACAAPAALAGTRLCQAGPPLIDGQPVKVWEGDFDGDGKPDRLWVRPPGTPLGYIEMATDPWIGFRRRYNTREAAIVIAHGHRCGLIQHPRFFSTPIWEAADKPISILRRSDPSIKNWPRVSRRWRGDGVLLGTEAGIDELLLWDGRRWRIVRSADTP